MSGPPISSSRRSGLTLPGKVILTLALGGFAIPGLLGTFAVGGEAVKSAGTFLWRARECEILKSAVAEEEGDDGEVRFTLAIAYRYEVAGSPHVSRVLRREGMTFATREEAQRVADAYPVGSHATCRVDPTSPDRAVLRASSPAPVALLLLPLAFVIGPLVGIVAVWRHKPRGSGALSGTGQTTGSSPRPIARPFPTEPVLLPMGGGRDAVAASGVLKPTLRPHVGPWLRLLGMTVAAFFWNGVMGMFVVVLAGEWRAGHWPIFGTLFLTPLLLIGLGLLGGVGYYLLACFNPRPLVTLDPAGGVAVGDNAALRWRLASRAGRIACLSITLEGREEVTYIQGTDAKTDTEVFHRATLVTATSPWEVASGEVRVSIPASTMHTFTATHNKVRWVITIHGDIPRWPDLKEELDITVLPAPDRGEAA
jgi:hypothetical protein